MAESVPTIVTDEFRIAITTPVEYALPSYLFRELPMQSSFIANGDPIVASISPSSHWMLCEVGPSDTGVPIADPSSRSVWEALRHYLCSPELLMLTMNSDPSLFSPAAVVRLMNSLIEALHPSDELRAVLTSPHFVHFLAWQRLEQLVSALALRTETTEKPEGSTNVKKEYESDDIDPPAAKRYRVDHAVPASTSACMQHGKPSESPWSEEPGSVSRSTPRTEVIEEKSELYRSLGLAIGAAWRTQRSSAIQTEFVVRCINPSVPFADMAKQGTAVHVPPPMEFLHCAATLTHVVEGSSATPRVFELWHHVNMFGRSAEGISSGLKSEEELHPMFHSLLPVLYKDSAQFVSPRHFAIIVLCPDPPRSEEPQANGPTARKYFLVNYGRNGVWITSQHKWILGTAAEIFDGDEIQLGAQKQQATVLRFSIVATPLATHGDGQPPVGEGQL